LTLTTYSLQFTVYELSTIKRFNHRAHREHRVFFVQGARAGGQVKILTLNSPVTVPYKGINWGVSTTAAAPGVIIHYSFFIN
jgi:hypothetical protein